MAEYRLTPRAEKDLEEIWRFTAKQWSVEQADKYVSGLLDAMQVLAGNPQSGRSAAHIRPGYRRRNAAAHVVFYVEASYGIAVIRVLHQRMDLESHFGPD